MSTPLEKSAQSREASTVSGQSDWQLKAVTASVLLYLIGLLSFFPSAITNGDELFYLESAHAFSEASSCVEEIDALSGEMTCRRGKFLPGTAALMTPFIVLFGWRGAYLVPALSLAAATFVTALWIRAAGRSPLFAFMVLGYLPSLVLGRVAMSDVPSTALVALGLWLFWTGGSERRARWAASGFVAGLSLSFRETNVLLFAPFYLGAVIRRQGGVGWLILGGLAGSLLRLLGTWLVYGDPLYSFRPSPTFALAHVLDNLPVHAMALLLFVPAGLIAGLLYRGSRRPEVVIAVLLFCVPYFLFGYHGEQSGLLKGLVLGPRYFAPLTPLLAFAAAETLPRLWASVRARAGRGTAEAMQQLTTLGVRLWVAGVMVMAFAVHPVFAHLTSSATAFREVIYSHSDERSVLVVDLNSMKFVNLMFGERSRLDFRALTPEILDQLLARHGTITVVILDRADSAFWRERARVTKKALDVLMSHAEFELLFDSGPEASEHLRIWRVSPNPG